MLVSDLKTALKRYGFDDNDPLLVWLNAALHEIEGAKDFWKWLEKTEEKSLVAATSTFITTSPMSRPLKVQDITTSGEFYELVYWDRRKFVREELNPAATGSPEIYFLKNEDEFQVWPVPTSTRKIEAIFIQALQDMVSDAAEPPIPVKDHYAIVLRAAAIGLMAESEEDRATTAMGEFEGKLERMIEWDNKRQSGDMESVEDVMGYGVN